MRKFSVMGENLIFTGEWASLRILFHSHHHFSAAVSLVVGIAESIVMVFLHLIITVSWRLPNIANSRTEKNVKLPLQQKTILTVTVLVP